MRLINICILTLVFGLISSGQSKKVQSENSWNYVNITNINYSLKDNVINVTASADSNTEDVKLEYVLTKSNSNPDYLRVLVLGRRKPDSETSSINVKDIEYKLKIDLKKNNGTEGIELIELIGQHNLTIVSFKMTTFSKRN